MDIYKNMYMCEYLDVTETFWMEGQVTWTAGNV